MCPHHREGTGSELARSPGREPGRGRTRALACVTWLQSPCLVGGHVLATAQVTPEKGSVRQGSAHLERQGRCSILHFLWKRQGGKTRMAESPAIRGLGSPARLHKPLCLEAGAHSERLPPLPHAESGTPVSPDSRGQISAGRARSRRDRGPDVGSGGVCPPSLPHTTTACWTPARWPSG